FGLNTDNTLSQHQRHSRIEVLPKLRTDLRVFGQLCAEKRGGRHHVVRASQTLEHNVAEAAPYRIAHQKRAGQYRDSHAHTGYKSGVRTPVVEKTAADELSRFHATG